MDNKKLYDERLERIRKAVALEEVDKIPFAPCGNAAWANLKGVPMSKYITDFEVQCDANLEILEEFDADATQATIFSPYLLSGQWLCNVAVPGKELEDHELWQPLEEEMMSTDDYDAIIDMGFEPWYEKYMLERLDDNDKKLAPFFDYLPTANQRHIDEGRPCICDFLMITPFEYFSGGRSLTHFFMDLVMMPDKIEEVFKITHEAMMKKYRAMMEQIKPIGVWIGGWRTAPEMMSPQMWERFAWPYIKDFGNLCIEMGVIPIFHLDSNWDRGLERFREFPAKKCIMALDGVTNIRKAKEVVGDMMCIMGDVPAQMTAFDTYDEVHEYTTKLIDDLGPTGYILATGCDVPSNVKRHNVQALADVAHNYLKHKKSSKAV